jgi:hypothetical protein
MQDSKEEASDAGRAEEYPTASGFTADLELRFEFQKILRRRDNIGHLKIALGRLQAGEKILGLETRFSAGEEEERALGARRKVAVQDVPQIPLPPEKQPEEREEEEDSLPGEDPVTEGQGTEKEASAAEGQDTKEETPAEEKQGEEDESNQ